MVCGREAEERIRLFPFFSVDPGNRRLGEHVAHVLQTVEAETGGQQLLYHGRTWGVGGLARDLLDKYPLLSEEKYARRDGYASCP